MLPVPLAAETEVLCSCRASHSISDQPLRHGPEQSEGCLGHSAKKEPDPNESSALLPLQERRERLQSAPK